PADTRPEAAYEAGMLEQDTGHLLLPIIPDAFHPGVIRLRELLRGRHQERPSEDREAITRHPGARISASSPESPNGEPATAIQVLDQPRPRSLSQQITSSLGELLLIEVERHSTGEVLTGTDIPGAPPCVEGWDGLRALGGEIAEVSALAPGEEMEPGTPLVLSGLFENRGLFQVSLLPRQQEARLRVRVTATAGQAELVFPLGTPGPAFLSWREAGEEHEESWDAWDPWPEMVRVVEEVVAATGGRRPT